MNVFCSLMNYKYYLGLYTLSADGIFMNFRAYYYASYNMKNRIYISWTFDSIQIGLTISFFARCHNSFIHIFYFCIFRATNHIQTAISAIFIAWMKELQEKLLHSFYKSFIFILTMAVCTQMESRN